MALTTLLGTIEGKRASTFLLSTKKSVIEERHGMVAAVLHPWVNACYYMQQRQPPRTVKDEILALLNLLEVLSEETNPEKIKALTECVTVAVAKLPMASLWLFIVQSFSTEQQVPADEWTIGLEEVTKVVGKSPFALKVFELFAELIANLTQAAGIRPDGRIPLLKDAVSKYVQSKHYAEKTGGTWHQLLDTYVNFYEALMTAIKTAAINAECTLTEGRMDWLVAFKQQRALRAAASEVQAPPVPEAETDLTPGEGDFKLRNG